ncbi:meiosis-specific protein MEI4 isoform X6 [Phyllopteryx taeniolatus]|uniref:meiosis-specific protein MEI4 isoform X6 n=1 Tax=Phyllopteryx taeniolatus TaxID=161469 RepID=UPI002AD4EDEA|nr:meiosis-specific protein MEI4 isoform X6 [Phyllopteryx taeniolatus]
MKYLRLRNLLLLLHCSGGEAFGTMCCDGCVCPECFGAKVSVAVAMSVIRRRPAGVGVGRHVHTLAARLTEGEQTWRSKAELLQQEVLGLRQALLVATATATESTGPDVTTESDSDTPELLQLVPAQQQQLPSNRQQAAQRRAELPHEHFLHSCCAFQRADPPWLGPGRDTDTAEVSADAPCRLLDTLAATFRERSLVGGAGRLALKACRASARAMDLFSSRGAPSARLTTRLQASLRELAAILLHASRQPTVDVSASCLAALGRSRMAKPFLVGHILSEVSVLADALCRAVQENASVDKIPVDEYHNALRLLTILEELLSDSRASRRKSEQTESLQYLERQTLTLWQEFPLFAVSVWRVAALVGTTDVPSSAPNGS